MEEMEYLCKVNINYKGVKTEADMFLKKRKGSKSPQYYIYKVKNHFIYGYEQRKMNHQPVDMASYFVKTYAFSLMSLMTSKSSFISTLRKK